MQGVPDRSPENRSSQQLIHELVLIFLFSLAVFLISARNDVLEGIMALLRPYEAWELDEIMVVALFLVPAMSVFFIRRWILFRKVKATLVKRNNELQQVLIQIKELKGVLPICSVCKKIRDDEDSWHQLEEYIESHTHAEFTHGICPDCTRKLYPEYDAYRKAR